MPNESPSNAPSHDAQREMEQRALRNVRALVDKIQDEDSRRKVTLKTVLLTVAGVVAFIVIGIALIVAKGKNDRRDSNSVVILPPPANAPR